MKLIHVLILLLAVIGGLHLALSGLGIDLLGVIFGGVKIAVIQLLIGVSILYHVVPVLKAHLGNH